MAYNSKKRQSGVDKRKEYQRPEVKIIELKAEETLAVGCKLADGGSASGGFTCVSNACAEPGS